MQGHGSHVNLFPSHCLGWYLKSQGLVLVPRPGLSCRCVQGNSPEGGHVGRVDTGEEELGLPKREEAMGAKEKMVGADICGHFCVDSSCPHPRSKEAVIFVLVLLVRN